ncbi:MAG: LysR family transcriptional regulator [Chlamydiales bacterium]
MTDLSRMRVLVLVEKLKSLTAAARALNISSAAVSKQLTRLEEELGLQLLIRSTRHVELTEVGLNYCGQCQRVLEEVDQAEALVSQLKVVPQGSLRVVSARQFGDLYIVPHLKEFLLKYPNIQLHLELAERIPDLVNESIDLMIGMSISASGDAIQKRIGSTRYVYCASPAYLQKFGLPQEPQDLLHHHYITHSMRKPDNELIFKNHEIISLIPYLFVNDSETMLKLALDDLGIIKVHYYMVQELLQKGKLIELLSSYIERSIPLYVAYPKRRFIPSKVRCFIDFVVEMLKFHTAR